MTQDSSEAPLHGAAAAGDVVGVRAVLNAGADVDFRDDVGDTALSLGVRRGHETLALIGAGANLSDGDSRTSLLTSAIAAGH